MGVDGGSKKESGGRLGELLEDRHERTKSKDGGEGEREPLEWRNC